MEVLEAVQFLLNNLGISGVGEDNNAIWFYARDIDGIEYGFFKVKKEFDLTFLSETQEIKENWYYYNRLALQI